MNKITVVISNEGTDVIKKEIEIKNSDTLIKFLEKLESLLKETKEHDTWSSFVKKSEKEVKDVFKPIFPFDDLNNFKGVK